MNLEMLRGRRTYLTCLVGLALLLAHWLGWLVLPAEIYSALMFLALCALRSAVADVAGADEEPAPLDPRPSPLDPRPTPTPAPKVTQ